MGLSSNIKSPRFTRIGVNDLQILFQLYDEIFFNHWFVYNFKGQMKFSLSTRLTKSAGKTICPVNIQQLRPEQVVLEIRMGVDFFLRYYEVSGDQLVSGLVSRNALEALQLVFEHELCHVIEFLYFFRSACGQKRFKNIARQLFGHRDIHHRLPTPSVLLQEKYGLKLGETVAFFFEEQELQGLLYNINKRAVVLVKDKKGNFIDQRGTRYAKYYVPLERLIKISNS